MKKRDKMKGKKGYAILALVIAISFITVLTWHDLVQASYKTKENAGSTSFPNNDKYTYVEVKGPSGTSTLKLQVTHSGSACKNYSFDNASRTLNIKQVSASNPNPYGLKLSTTSVKTTKSHSGSYSWISVKVKYTVPAHQKYNNVTYDTPSSQSHKLTKTPDHSTKEQTDFETTIGLSAYDTGVAPYKKPSDQKYYRYYDCKVTINLNKTQYKVTYKGNNGTIASADSTKSFACGSKLTFPVANRTGYTLTGWKDTANSTGMSYTTNSTICGKALTLHAQWKANQYKIHYNSNGGSGTMNDSTVTYDGSFTLPKNTFTNNGYQFLGWSKTKDGDVAAYEDQEAIKYQMASDLTLYAIWGNGQYKISFMPNGAQADAKSIPVKTGESYTIPSGLFTRKGYTFVGWAKTPDAVRADYTNGAAVSDLTDVGKTIKLYAIWKKNDGSINKTNIIHDEGMFTGDIEIEGQNGTGYSHAHTDSEYANIDKTDAPGYFTDRYR